MEDDFVAWESVPPATNVFIQEIDHFDARGMRRVYGRGDLFSRHKTFHMDIWMDCNQILWMRCWSRCGDIDWRSFIIKGIDHTIIPLPDKNKGLQDFWVPEAVREAYCDWLQEEF